MAQQIVHFGVRQTAKVCGVLYGLMGLIAAPIVLLAWIVAPAEVDYGPDVAIALPFFYAIAGYVFTAIACVLYNLVARRIGGIEVEVSQQAGPSTVQHPAPTA